VYGFWVARCSVGCWVTPVAGKPSCTEGLTGIVIAGPAVGHDRVNGRHWCQGNRAAAGPVGPVVAVICEQLGDMLILRISRTQNCQVQTTWLLGTR
jgi:hypothetical protein